MKNILLIGAGHFGRHIAMQLSQLGHQVMAVDTDEERINDVLPFVTKAQIGDSTNAEFLRALGIRNFDVCFVTISGNFQNSLETTSLLKELGAKCVVSRAERDVQAKFLLRNGADNVVYPEKQMAIWAAKRYTADHIFDYIEIDKQHAIFEVEVPKAWVGKSIGTLDIRKKFGINILGIKRLGKTDVSITPDTIFSDDITLLALGEYNALLKCFRIIAGCATFIKHRIFKAAKRLTPCVNAQRQPFYILVNSFISIIPLFFPSFPQNILPAAFPLKRSL